MTRSRLSGPAFSPSAAALGLWRRSVPAITTLVAILLMTAPLPLPVPALPQLALLSVLIWASFQPALMAPLVAFGLGVVADLALGQPLGLSATLFPVVALVGRLLLRLIEQHGHTLDWLLAAAVILAYQLLAQALAGLAGTTTPLWPWLLQALLTIAAYPLAVAALSRVQRRLLGA